MVLPPVAGGDSPLGHAEMARHFGWLQGYIAFRLSTTTAGAVLRFAQEEVVKCQTLLLHNGIRIVAGTHPY